MKSSMHVAYLCSEMPDTLFILFKLLGKTEKIDTLKGNDFEDIFFPLR